MTPPGPARTVLLIDGMRDNTCREVVLSAIEKVLGVREVHVNLYRGRADVVHDQRCSPADLKQAVHAAGYIATTVSP